LLPPVGHRVYEDIELTSARVTDATSPVIQPLAKTPRVHGIAGVALTPDRLSSSEKGAVEPHVVELPEHRTDISNPRERRLGDLDRLARHADIVAKALAKIWDGRVGQRCATPMLHGWNRGRNVGGQLVDSLRKDLCGG
jgi:hypothetical protein